MNCKLYIIKTASELWLIYYSSGEWMKIKALYILVVCLATTQQAQEETASLSVLFFRQVELNRKSTIFFHY